VKRLFRLLALYAFHLGFVRPVVKWFIGTRVRRRSLLPAGPCLVVSNHNSHLDAAILMSLFPLRRLSRVRPVAAADYFGSTMIKRFVGLLLMNGLPIDRKASRGSDPLAPLVEEFKRGNSLIFFPEGSRGKAGVMAPFRAGVGQLVHKVPGLLIVPVYLSGPERIWARGQTVPVPLNVDAVVGKPRSYSPEMEPRAIAEAVRNDVLALAPPVLPVPGPRPNPPTHVAICGIDGEHRRKLLRAVMRRLAGHGRTLGLGDTVFLGDDDGVREVSRPFPFTRPSAFLGPFARIFRMGGKFRGQKFTKLVERTQLDEAFYQGHDYEQLISDGNGLVDLISWAEADFYRGKFDEAGINHLMQYLAGHKKIPFGRWWEFIRKAPGVWLINIFDLARPPVPDVLVVVGTSVDAQMERLRSMGEELELYQNEEFLARWQEAYRHVGRVLKRRRRLRLLEVDASELGLDEIATVVADAIKLET
jgi:1-acyl-sn-glycerol-3-phosphate acyltransferase